MGNIRVGLDIGGTKIAAIATDGQGTPLTQVTFPTDSSTGQAFVHRLEETIAVLLRQARASAGDIAAIGAGVPGQVHQESGRVRRAVNLDLEDFPLRATLEAQYHCPVYIENDVATAAIGAFQRCRQVEPALRHLIYISIGTGIAAGLILDGRLHRGANGLAGEIGHVIVEPGGALCNCGARGCLETIVAGPAMARQAASFLPGPVATQDLYHAGQQNMPEALQLIDHVSSYLAQAILWLMMVYDADRIVLGGGVTSARAAFLDPLLTALARLTERSPLARAMLSGSNPSLLPVDYSPGLWGAIHLAEQAILVHHSKAKRR